MTVHDLVRRARSSVRSRSGVTLLESMVALAILGGAGSVILGSLSVAHNRLWVNEVITAGIRGRETLLDEILLNDVDGMLDFDGFSEEKGHLTDPSGELSFGTVQTHERHVSIQPSSIQVGFGQITRISGMTIRVYTIDTDGWMIELTRFVPVEGQQ